MTAIELMPVHQFVQDTHLQEKGLSNYWGYNTIGFFAPHNGYSSTGTRGQQVRSSRRMVKALHEAGIEVILDVVYNHTAEGNQLRPDALLPRHRQRQLLPPRRRRARALLRHHRHRQQPADAQPHVLQLIMDSLRYWVLEMHVDGFRFDLAATLARQFHEVDRLSAFFDLVQQDPVVSQVKLIAEPWDLGDGGYQVGNFPPLWTEWNGKYRDTVRDFWRGEPATLGEFASRLTGLVATCTRTTAGARSPASTSSPRTTASRCATWSRTTRSATTPTARAATTARATTARGTAASRARPTTPRCSQLRARQQRNFLTTLLLSQGVPMIAHGDEIGRTQRGNNNVYCQDNELAWVDWDLDEAAGRPARVHPSSAWPCARTTRSSGAAGSSPATPSHGGESELGDIAWFTPTGEHMGDEHWHERVRPVGDGVPQRRRDPRAGPARPAGRRRLVPGAVQRAPRGAGVHAARRPSTERAGRS